MANSTGGGGKRRAVTFKQGVVAVLAVVLLVLAVANADPVKVDFVVGDVDVRLFLVIVGSALVGWLIGWFTARRGA